MKPDKIYPEIDITITDETIVFETVLRKLHTDGKWYKQHIKDSWRLNEVTTQADCFSRFSKNVYDCIVMGVVVPGLMFPVPNMPPINAFELDKDQMNEVDRLSGLFALERPKLKPGFKPWDSEFI